MIERELRRELRHNLQQLIEGLMTNDDFDARYEEAYRVSSDLAVREIAMFGWSLYSSDVWPYRLQGRHAVDASTRSAAERAMQFLDTDQEYSYPEYAWEVRAWVALFEFFIGLIGVACCIMAVIAWVGGDNATAIVCGGFGAGLLVFSGWSMRLELRSRRNDGSVDAPPWADSHWPYRAGQTHSPP
jgi:hypothetical protein